MSQSTEDTIAHVESVMNGRIDEVESHNRAIDAVGSSLTDTRASEASDPAEAPTAMVNGETVSSTILKAEIKVNGVLDEAVEAGNEITTGEVSRTASDAHVRESGPSEEVVHSEVVHNVDAEVPVDTPVVAKMILELQAEQPANLPSDDNSSEDADVKGTVDAAIPSSTTPTPFTPPVDAAPEAGPETATSSTSLAITTSEFVAAPPLEEEEDTLPTIQLTEHEEATEPQKISTTSAPASMDTSSSSNDLPSTASEPSASQIAPEHRIITTSEATASSPALLETLTTPHSQSDGAKSPETSSHTSSSAVPPPTSAITSSPSDQPPSTTDIDIKEISTTKTDSENPSRKSPPVASSSAPDLRASIVERSSASTNDKPASLQGHSGSMGSRMMNIHEENELERLRAERAQRPHGRRGAFYAPPPPAFRPKLGANHNDVIVDPPLSNSGIVLPLSLTPAAKPAKETKTARRITLGWAETTGKRPTMEDAWTSYSQGKDSSSLDVFGVFDGHRGDSAAKFAAEHLSSAVTSVMRVSKNPGDWLRLGFIQTNLAMKQAGIATGTTAVVGMYWKNVVYLANAGDSRCVHGRVGTGPAVATRMTQDHKPERIDETERIVALGGEVHTSVNKDGKVVGRVNGQLGVSRALGDFDLEPFIIPDPEITSIDLLKPGTLTESIHEEDENVATSSSAPGASSTSSSAPRASSSNSASPSNHSALNAAHSNNQSPSGNVLANHAVSSPSSPANNSTAALASSPHVSSLTSSAPPASPMMDSAANPANPRAVHNAGNGNGTRSLNSSPMKNKPRPISTNGKRPKGETLDGVEGIPTTTNHFDFLVMACDGLWDVVTDEEAVDIAAHVLQHNQTPEEAAKRLRNIAYGRGSADNITVLVILLQTPVLGLKKSSSCIIL